MKAGIVESKDAIWHFSVFLKMLHPETSVKAFDLGGILVCSSNPFAPGCPIQRPGAGFTWPGFCPFAGRQRLHKAALLLEPLH